MYFVFLVYDPFLQAHNEESSRVQKQPPETFYKKDVLKSFSKFAGKYLYQSLFVFTPVFTSAYPVDTGRKLNVHKSFNLRPVSVG